MRKQQQNFESYRNNTNIFNIIEQWRTTTATMYETSRLGKVLSKYQYQLCKYMTCEELPSQEQMMPRGILIQWEPGSGKTLGFVSAGLYTIHRKKKEYTNGVIVIITNKSLQQKTTEEITNYLVRLNQQGLGVDLIPSASPINIDTMLQKIKFITYNDSRNLEKNLVEQFNALRGFENRFVVVDEAHNLFRSKSNDDPNSRGNILYNLLMNYETLQLIFATGTPILTDPIELTPCFQMLTKNPNILDDKYFNEIFVSSRNQHINREILVRRIYGLIQLVYSESTDDKPELLPVIVHQLMMSDAIAGRYTVQRRKEGVKDSFMQGSRQISNAIIIHKQNGDQIISDKFTQITETIKNNSNQLQMIYSNFVQNGCVLFRDFCFQQEGDMQWQEVIIDNKGQYKVTDGKVQQILTPRTPKQLRLILVHGDIPIEDRNLLIKLFNSKDNTNGQLANVIILSPASMEGLNLHCVRHVHILEPQWSWTSTEQAIYRAVRRGSHLNLEPEERTVQPHLYLSYNNLVIDPEPINKTSDSLFSTGYSTDQIIYYKSKIKYHLNKQFLQSIAMASFNCNDYKGFMAVQIQQHFLFDFPEEGLCYKCQSNDKPLFAPDNIYKDFAFNNCIREIKQQAIQPMQYIRLGHIEYGYIYDPYSRYGIRFYEIRDTTRTDIPEDSDLFQRLLSMFKARVIPVEQKQQQSVQQKPDTIQVRIYKSEQLEEPDRSNINYVLQFIGSVSNTIKGSFLFGVDTLIYQEIQKKSQIKIQDIQLSPASAVLLLHFSNNIQHTQQQITKLLITIYGKSFNVDQVLTTDKLMNAISKLSNHSLHNFRDIYNDLQQLERQSYIYNMQQYTFKRLCEELIDIIVNQIQSSQHYQNIFESIDSLIKNQQLIFTVPVTYSQLDMYLIKHILIRLTLSEAFQQKVPEQIQTIKNTMNSQKESFQDKPQKKQYSPVLIAALINQLFKPRTLQWKPKLFSEDREQVNKILNKTDIIYGQSNEQEQGSYVLKDYSTLIDQNGREIDIKAYM